MKIEALTRARAQLSRVVADLFALSETIGPAVRLAGVLEADVLPLIGGMLRRAERSPARGARRLTPAAAPR